MTKEVYIATVCIRVTAMLVFLSMYAVSPPAPEPQPPTNICALLDQEDMIWDSGARTQLVQACR